MGRTIYLLLQIILTLADIISHVQGSGTLYDPPNRAVMWKYGYQTSKNYNYMQLNCGGEKQNEKGNWTCGVCGDAYKSTREHELGGRYAIGMISRYYPAGIKEMPVKVELLAYEKGFFEFRLCSADKKKEVTQECLDENILPIKEGYLAGSPLRFYPKGAGDFRLTVAVPPNMTCDRCVLQWRYHTANSWGTNPDTYKEGLGEGPQEEFRNCADIRIGGTIPNSVRRNPFFAPPDARPGSAIDKPTDQRKKLATRKDKLDISVISGGIQSASGWVDGKTGKTSEIPMRIPDVKHSGTQVIDKQVLSVKRHGTSRVIPMVGGTEGSILTKQTNFIHQNDINAKQHNGLFSLDNVLQDASKIKQSGEQSISGGTVEIIGHRKQVGSLLAGGRKSKMTSGTGFSGSIDSRMAQGVDLSGGMDSQITQHTDLAGGIGSHMTQDSGFTEGTESHMAQGAGLTGKMASHMSPVSSITGGMDSQITLGTDITGGMGSHMAQGTGLTGGMDSQNTQGTRNTGGVDTQITLGTDLTGDMSIQITKDTDFTGGIDSHMTQGTGLTGGMDSHMTQGTDLTGGMDSQMTQGTRKTGGMDSQVTLGTGLTGGIQMTKDTGFTGGMGSQKTTGAGFTEGINGHMTHETGFTAGMGSHMTQGTDVTGGIKSHMTQGTGNTGGIDSKISLGTDLTGVLGGEMTQETGFTGSMERQITQGTGLTAGIDSIKTQRSDFSGGVDSKIRQSGFDRGATIRMKQESGLVKELDSHLTGETSLVGEKPSGQTASLVDHSQPTHGIGGQLAGNTDGHLSFGIDAHMLGAVDGISTNVVGRKTSQSIRNAGRTGDQMRNSEVQSRIEGRSMLHNIHLQEGQGHGSIEHGGRPLLHGAMNIASDRLGTNTGGKIVHTESVIPIGSAVQRVERVERTIGITNLDPTMGAVGPAPKPEKKSSILIEGASILKKPSGPSTGKIKAATRSGFAMSGDKSFSNNMNTDTKQLENTRQQTVKTSPSSGGVFLDLSQHSGQKSVVSSKSNTPINELQTGIVAGQSRQVDSVASGGIERSHLRENMFPDLTIDGTQSNTITDKVNTNLDKRLAAQNVAFKNIHQPIITAGTGNGGMNTHPGSSSTNVGEMISGTAGSTTFSESLKGSHMDGKVVKRQNVVETVQSGKGDILSSGQNELPHTISSLTPSSSRQRIFLVRASRPSTVVLSGTAEGSNGGMTVSESVHSGNGLVHTSVDKTSSALGKTLFQEKTNNMQSGKKSPNNAAIKLSTSNRQETSSSVQPSLLSEIDVNSLTPVSKLDFAVGRPLADVTASEVIDPARTQMTRSDGRVAGEHELIPSGNTVSITEKNVHATSGHASSGSGGALINDVDLFRNELVKSSLRQGSALAADKAAVKTHAHTEAVGHANTEQHTGSSNIDGTNLLASNEIGGKLGSKSLDQTVNDLLIEAQKILSSTADITSTQTATDTASVGRAGTAPVADILNEKTQVHKHASLASPEISGSVHGSHATSIHSHMGSTGAGVDQASRVNKGNQGHVDIHSTVPKVLTVEYLLGGSINGLGGTSTDSLGHLVESAHGHHEHAISVGGTRGGGSAKNEHMLSSAAQSVHNISPESHGTGGIIDVGAEASQHSAGFHTNIIDVKSKAGHMSEPTAEHGNNVLASHTKVHGVDVGVDPSAALLSLIDTIGPDTGIVFNDAGAGSTSNVNPIAAESLAGNQQTTGLELIRSVKNTAFVNPSGTEPGMTSADHFGSIGLQNVINKPIGINSVSPVGSGVSPLSKKIDLTVGSVKRQQSVQPVLDKKGSVSGSAATGTLVGSVTNLASGIDTGTAVRLGGNVIDLTSDSSKSKDTKRLTTGTGLGQSQTGTDVTDINLLSAGRTLRQRHGIIPDHIVDSRGASAQTSSGSSSLGRVDRTVSSRSQRRRVIGANNIVTAVGQTDSVPRTDGVSIEQQINSFNLENVPSSAVIGAGVQMTADGRMTAGFGPRGRDMPGERITEERRLMSRARENMRRDVVRGDLNRRTSGSSDGSFRMVRDPRTGLEERIPSGVRRSGNIRGSSINQRATIEDRHSHHSGSSGSESNPVYFLDMSGSASSDTRRMADSTTIRELPSAEIGRSSSERRATEFRDERRRVGGAAGAGFETRVGGSRSIADSGRRVRGGDLGMDSVRRTGIDRGSTRLEMGMRSSGSATDSGTRFRETDFRTDTRRQTGAERGGTRFEIGMGSSGSASGSRTGFMESGFRTDSIRRTGADRVGAELDNRIRGSGSSPDSRIRFREGIHGAGSGGRTGGSVGVAGFDVRMGGSRSIGGTGTGFREGDFRMDTRRMAGDRARASSDFIMGAPGSTLDSSFGVRDGGFRMDSSRRMAGDFRGERRADMRREGMRMLSRRRESELGDRRIPEGSAVVPFGAPMTSTSGSFGGTMPPMSDFSSGMPPFDRPFPRGMGSGSMMGVSMSGPFDGRFRPMGVGPRFGPSFVPSMEPPRMGPGIGMPPFSPMDFGPGML